MLSSILSLLTPEFVGKMVRTAIQSACASLVTKGIIDGDQQTAIAAAVAGLVSIIWTAVAHAKQAPAVAANNTIGGLQ